MPICHLRLQAWNLGVISKQVATAATRVDVYAAQMGVEKDKLLMMVTCGEGGSKYQQTQMVFREIWP